MKLKNKIISLIISLSFCLVALFNAIYFSDKNIKTHETIMNKNEIDYMSLLDEFDESEVIENENSVKVNAIQYVDEDFFDIIDNASSNSEISKSEISYDVNYDKVTNTFVLVTIAVDKYGNETRTETVGAPFINEIGEVDALFLDDEGPILLSELSDANEVNNCGFFSRLKKAIKKVAPVALIVAAVVTVAIVVAVAAPAAVAAASSASAMAIASGGTLTLGATISVGASAAATAAAGTIGAAAAVGVTIGAGIVATGAAVDNAFNAIPNEITTSNINKNGINEVNKNNPKNSPIKEMTKGDLIAAGITEIIVKEVTKEGNKLIIKGEPKVGSIKEIRVNESDIIPDKGFNSFDELKKYLGTAGEGKAWHHIVEQSQINLSNFDEQMIHNIKNIISIESGFAGSIHGQITGYYNSKPTFAGGLSVREWLAKNKTFEEQFLFGLDVLRRYGEVVATKEGWKLIPFDK